MPNSFRGGRFYLSNFYPVQMQFMVIEVPTAEHMFQALKCVRLDDFYSIVNAETPKEAKRLGREVTIRTDWEDIKLHTMQWVTNTKFGVNVAEPSDEQRTIAQLLLNTGNEEIVEENEWGDTVWGTCAGVGQNLLGECLMTTRENLRLTTQ